VRGLERAQVHVSSDLQEQGRVQKLPCPEKQCPQQECSTDDPILLECLVLQRLFEP
jgi:hypothetical protein